MKEIDLSKNIGIISQGVDCIADGRIFYIAGSLEDGEIKVPELNPPTLTKFFPTYKDNPLEIIGKVDNSTPLTCGDCDKAYARCLFLHTENWMFSGLSCINHPMRVLLDIFPKPSPETSQQWFNSYLGFGVYLSLPEGLVIEPPSQGDDYQVYLKLKKSIRPTYSLTQSGLEKI